MKKYQQGDVIVRAVKALPKTEKELVESGILAYGEATGHKHQIVGPGKLYRINGELWIDASGEITVKHEEHKPITLPAGTYKVGGVKEWDHFKEEARQVAD